MIPKLLVYIVSYQRKEYTQGNVMSITQILPENINVIQGFSDSNQLQTNLEIFLIYQNGQILQKFVPLYF